MDTVTGVVAAVVKIPQAFPLFSLFMFEGESEFYHKRTVLMNDLYFAIKSRLVVTIRREFSLKWN